MTEETRSPQARVARAVSGMVAGGYALDYDLAAGAVPCDRCEAGLAAGDRVTALLGCYEGHTWEPYAVYCRDHGVESLSAVGGEDADEGAVVAATLEPTGYRDPQGGSHPDAVTLGGVEVLDYSPLAYD